MPSVGEEVRIHCKGMLSDGRVFCDTRAAGEPISFRVGSRTLLPEVEHAVVGMGPGERLRLTVPAAQAYGEYDEALVEEVPCSTVPHAERLPDDGYIVVDAGGEVVRVRVTKTRAGMVRFDHNHELAGEDLAFDLEYLGVAPETAVEHEGHAPGCACGCDKLKESLAR
ncbi:MAG: FKBP-type peptidyl-prolyl cis-trans isomerase [Eggerthellaceae bacterium]|nr:FKBP-type peptidyl-prolyl cis-trans isomerase [Eggerthellaceae bacterium]